MSLRTRYWNETFNVCFVNQIPEICLWALDHHKMKLDSKGEEESSDLKDKVWKLLQPKFQKYWNVSPKSNTDGDWKNSQLQSYVNERAGKWALVIKK